MSELSRAHDTSTAAVAYDGVVGDVKEADEDEPTKGVEALKIAKPPASNGRSSYWAANNGEVVLFYLTDDDDDDVEATIAEKLTYMPDEWPTLNTFTDLRAPPTEAASSDSIVGRRQPDPREKALDCNASPDSRHNVRTLDQARTRTSSSEIMKLKHDAIVLRKSMESWLPKLEDLPEKAREKWGNEEITTTLLSSTSRPRGKTYRFVLSNGKHTVDKEYILRTETGDSGHYFLRKNDVDEWHFISRTVRDKQAPLEGKAALDALRASNEDDGT